MRKTELENCPWWLMDADTENEDVEMINGKIVWYDGVWKSGEWYDGTWYHGEWQNGVWNDGEWHDGVWKDGIWHSGTWYDGEWKNGVWKNGRWQNGMWCQGVWHQGLWYSGTWCGGTWCNGTWYSGTWRNGTWSNGAWYNGIWKGGTWHNGTWSGGAWYNGLWKGGTWLVSEDRLLFMAGLLGIVFKNGYATAYRTTRSNGQGKWNTRFVQHEGEYFEEDVAPAGFGTCFKGIHVTSASMAHVYFGISLDSQMWEVKFKQEDLLDCDGKKARIRGGVFTKINNPF